MRIEYKFIPGHEGRQYVKRYKLNGKIVLILQFRKVGCDTEAALNWFRTDSRFGCF